MEEGGKKEKTREGNNQDSLEDRRKSEKEGKKDGRGERKKGTITMRNKEVEEQIEKKK